MSLRLRRRPTRRDRAMRIVRVAQTEVPAIVDETDFSWMDDYRKTAMEYQAWLRRNASNWGPGVPRRDWRAYARDISGDTSRLSFVAGLLLGIAIGIIVALAMTVRPRRQSQEVEEDEFIVEIVTGEPEEDDELADLEDDGEAEAADELSEQTATAD